MDSNSQQGGEPAEPRSVTCAPFVLKDNSSSEIASNNPPPKPWERAGTSSGPAPFKPSSAGSTSEVVEASGTARPGEIVSVTDKNTAVNRNALGKPLPTRPWEQQSTYGNNYGGYGSGMNYNSGFSQYGGYGGSYGGGLYGNSMYRGGYGGNYGGSMYGGGMYGGSMGGYGMGMGGSPFGDQDPNNPFGPPSSPPGFWMSFLRVMHGVVNFFGRIAMLIDQNTQAFHMFMSALLQLFDRSGMLYGELARFALRLLGFKTKARRINPPGPDGLAAPENAQASHKVAPSGAWDNVWVDGK